MSPSLPTPAFLYILNIFLSPTLPKFPSFHNCHATPKGHGLPPPQKKKILNVHQQSCWWAKNAHQYIFKIPTLFGPITLLSFVQMTSNLVQRNFAYHRKDHTKNLGKLIIICIIMFLRHHLQIINKK